MAIYPGGRYRPVVGESKDPPIIPVGVILHVAASNADSLFGFFNGPSGGIESHFQIPLTSRAPVEQYRDTNREADANYKGNSWIGSDGKRYGFLSVETAGLGDGEWTAHQLSEILKLIRWAAREHGFPLRKAPGYRSPGLGYHVMFGSGEGTNSWSNARGKVCPGAKRIRQFENIILPALTQITPPPPPTKDDLDMPFKQQPGPVGHIVSEHSGLMLDLPFAGTNGARVFIYPGDGHDDQRWQIKSHGDGTVSLVTKHGTLALDVPSNRAVNDADLIVWNYHGGPEQRFRMVETAPGVFNLLHAASGKAVAVRHAGKHPGASVILYDLEPNPWFRWRLIPTV